MSLKIREIYSQNFDIKPRKRKNLKFLILHYTGMKSEKKAISRLIEIQSQVSTHYFIKKNGEVIRMVPDLYNAWHAGISNWGKYKNLNQYSIGIELSNPGHQYGYVNFSKKQIKSLIKLTKKIIKRYRIKKKYVLGHSDISSDRKKDPGEKFPWKILYRNQICIWHTISSKNLKPLRRKAASIKEKIHFMEKLKNFGYTLKYSNKKYSRFLVKAFQRRFRPELITGNIDKECLLIIKNLTK